MKNINKLFLLLSISILSVSVFACSGETETTSLETTENEMDQYLTETDIETLTLDTHRENTIYIDQGQVFTKGENRLGQLGDGTFIGKDIAVNITSQFALLAGDEVISVALGEFHAIALSESGRVFTWGHNSYGKLALAEGENQNQPVDITDAFNLNAQEKVVYISAGRDNNAVITNQNRVFTFGVNSYGQLGNGEINNPWEEVVYIPQDITNAFALDDDYIVKVQLGNNHSLALSAHGKVFAWGDNEFGQLASMEESLLSPSDITDQFDLEDDQIIDIEAGYNHSGVLTLNGRVFVFGDNSLGQLGLGLEPRKTSKAIEITDELDQAGQIYKLRFSHDSSAIIAENKTFVFGYNVNGQLGLGHQSTVNTPSVIDISNYNNLMIVDIFIAKETFAIVFEDGSMESQDLS